VPTERVQLDLLILIANFTPLVPLFHGISEVSSHFALHEPGKFWLQVINEHPIAFVAHWTWKVEHLAQVRTQSMCWDK
jgi:hypothetical protein